MNALATIALFPFSPLSEVIEALDKGAMRIVLIVDESNKLLGTITDGDIRRGLLRHLQMDAPASDIMRKDPVFALEADDRGKILAMMKSHDVLQVPIVNAKHQVVDMETLQHLIENNKHDNPVFLMAGGFGTRLHPLTKDKPKPLLHVGSRPILETILKRFIDLGFHQFYISTHYKAEMVRDYFGDGSKWEVNIQYIHEEEPLGTAGALGLLPDTLPNLPIIMMNGDLLTRVNFGQLLEFHHKQKGLVTMCVREYDFQVPYGVIETKEHRISSIVEKPVYKFFVNAGIYVIEPDLICQVDGAEYLDMPHLLEKQIESGEQINSFPLHEYWLDIGQLEEFERANREISE